MKKYFFIFILSWFLVLVVSTMHAAAFDINASGDQDNPETFTNGVRIDTLFFESFDDETPGGLPAEWTAVDFSDTTADPYWHLDTYNAYNGSWAWWCGGFSPTWRNSPGYGNDWYQFLILDADLSDETGRIFLTFQQRYEAEYISPKTPWDTWDGMNVRISTNDGKTWTLIHPYPKDYPYTGIYAFHLKNPADTLGGYSGPLQDWTKANFDISTYSGKKIKIAWVFASDSYCSDQDGMGGFDSDGAWFIDDIALLEYPSMDTIYFYDCESSSGSEWTAKVGTLEPAGQFWQVVDETSQPQPDDLDTYYSPPKSIYCGDPASSRGDGAYTPGDHESIRIDDGLFLPSIDCTGYENIKLNFIERYKGDGEGSYGSIDISTDGGILWNTLYFKTFNGRKDWMPHNTTILYGAGDNPDVRIRFTTSSGTGGGYYVYWYLDDITITGECTSAVAEGREPEGGQLLDSELYAIVPNPFNPITSIYYQTLKEGFVDLSVYNLSGTLVKTLVKGRLEAGHHTAIWNGTTSTGSSVTSGIYICRLVADGKSYTGKMVLLK